MKTSVPGNAWKKNSSIFSHSHTVKEIFKDAIAKSGVIHQFLQSLHLQGEGHPQGTGATDSVVRSLMVESAGRCAPEVSLPPAHWTVHKWFNFCIA